MLVDFCVREGLKKLWMLMGLFPVTQEGTAQHSCRPLESVLVTARKTPSSHVPLKKILRGAAQALACVKFHT